MAVLILLTAACGGSGSGSSSAGRSSSSGSPVGFSRCMRSHGVPHFPDPDSSGGIPKETVRQLGVSDSRYQAAAKTCAHLLPGGDSGRTQAEVQQWWRGMLSFARCMRSHGVSGWPDPTPYPPYPNEPTFNMPTGLQPTPQIVSKMRECQRLVPDNSVAGHIDNDNWQDVSREMAGR
ncbi:MAG TPA: hypothetical protein VH817_12365 [Thermoleophilaceae bacterium]